MVVNSYETIRLPEQKNRTKLKNLSKQPKPEILTDKDLLELMGVNRQTYVRNRGAVRRK